jgi:hypothetical protein
MPPTRSGYRELGLELASIEYILSRMHMKPPMVEEEEEIEEVHMFQNVVTTRISSKNTSFDNHAPYDPPKNTSHTQKTTDNASKQSVPSTPLSNLECDLLEYLNKTKEIISMLELMKLPHVRKTRSQSNKIKQMWK